LADELIADESKQLSVAFMKFRRINGNRGLPSRSKSMESLRHTKFRGVSPDRDAFTLVELLVVIVIVVIFMGLQLSAHSAAGTNSKGSQCLNNLRQLSLAWRMYAEDNHGYILYSSGASTAYNSTVPAWCSGALDFNPANRSNYDPAVDIMKSPMWQYNKNASTFKCPGDTSVVVVGGSATPRVRTYSMNIYLGGFGGSSEGVFSSTLSIYLKLSDLEDPVHSPGAANTFLFVEERQDAINWGNFLTDMAGFQPRNPAAYLWEGDVPGSYHDRAGGISFCDGHVEMHKWLDGRTTPPMVAGGLGSSTIVSPYNADIAWVQNVSTRSH
jgi:prepilin-type N-terminal cleavage/methylation domain-containing protein/prepilin-type processing-associated H-X9-DG protein